ncbi:MULTISPECIES: thioredoxin family protein [unclassified Tenacibaculum]|uniref:thioredoxin family protein n=1 Tax=unclassified Tenacibaculum TaxID=2635139 RepID=UPI001F2C8D1F|nr:MULTISPECIES: thioredoxin family protein [unclassified Tenacibaculum]MCF2873990.1 thioredoxin family protein [Tenacibaculum sp. Cn5-1]MCF2934571.1 thioredoxin family protein [Tenacibaculum sp. Cn5-34]MCG7510781.1 thioredoxin family protein [Tenacibaculum sp. Cn5-46]
MKKLFITAVFFISIIQKGNATQWMTSFEDAKKMSIATNKLILIDFWATWCVPCKKMESDTWNKPEIQEVLSAYVPLKIDIDVFRKVSNKYSANRIPYVLIVDANGEVVFNETGYKDKTHMLRVLKKYAINTKSFQEDFSNFYKKPTPDLTLSIAEKYFDTSLYVDESVKFKFIKLASTYLKKLKKTTNKKEYNEKFSQKADLLGNAYKMLIMGKNDKALKFLDNKFEEKRILPENKTLYDFIHFVAYKKLEDKENAKVWYNKLKEDKGFKKYLLKSRKI